MSIHILKIAFDFHNGHHYTVHRDFGFVPRQVVPNCSHPSSPAPSPCVQLISLTGTEVPGVVADTAMLRCCVSTSSEKGCCFLSDFSAIVISWRILTAGDRKTLVQAQARLDDDCAV